MNDVKVFEKRITESLLFKVRTIENDDGEPWFVAMDVAEALGYADSSKMYARLDEDEKHTRQIGGSGQMREMTIINESGLYNAIMGSTKAEAKVFKKWVTSEVLPSIRKTGGYGQLPQQPMPAMLPTTAAKITLNDLQDIGKMLGTPAHIVNTEAVKYISNTMHLDLTPLLAGSTVMDNIPNEDKMLEVTEIAKILGPEVSGMVVNRVLKNMGYQVSVGNRWSATQLGKPISTQHAWANGKKSGYNLKWNVSKVIEIYEAYCNV